jgi:hypothetical protein
MVNRSPLLERLAALGWFTQNGEVAATQALTMLLDDEVLHHAFVNYVEELTGTALPDIHVFEAERSHEGFGRPDIEGVDAQRQTVMIVEGKFWATLGVEQVQAYLAHLRQDRNPGHPTAFLVLLPQSRESEARRVVAAAAAITLDADVQALSVATAVMTWEGLLDRLDLAVASLEQGPHSTSADLVQFRGLCTTLCGVVIPPLDHNAPWRARKADLERLVELLTRELRKPGERLLPIVHEAGFDPMRYTYAVDPALPSGLYPFPDSYLSIGLSQRFADQGDPPLWMRYHKATPQFPAIRRNLRASPLWNRAREDDGHVWLPFTIREDLAGPDLVADLVNQVWSVQAALVA